MPNLKKEIGVIVNDLGIYHKGLEVAVRRNNIKDEVSYALAAILPLEQKAEETELVKSWAYKKTLQITVQRSTS